MPKYSITVLNRASDAIREIVRVYDIKEVLLPYYLCNSVRHALVNTGCKPIFYHIDDYFMPEKMFEKDDYIIYPNYFGICSSNITKLEKIYTNLIVDNAHSFFSPPQGLACFNAAYKFDLGNFSELYMKSNEGFCYEENRFSKEKDKRRKKFLELCELYNDRNIIKPDKNSIPFCYPFLAQTEKEANELVKNLKIEGYTIYRYWEQLPKSYNEYKFYSRLVPIPILYN